MVTVQFIAAKKRNISEAVKQDSLHRGRVCGMNESDVEKSYLHITWVVFFLPLDLPQKRRLPANPTQALLHLFTLSSLAAISWSCFVCRNPLTSLALDVPLPTGRTLAGLNNINIVYPVMLLLPFSSSLLSEGKGNMKHS
jgi:hypothetical protein